MEKGSYHSLALLCYEAGYIACEKGKSLEQGLQELQQLYGFVSSQSEETLRDLADAKK